MQVKDLFEGFIRDCKCELAESTIYQHTAVFQKVIIPSIGNIDLIDLLPIHRNDVLEQANRICKSMPRQAILTLRRLLHYVRKCRIPSGLIADELVIPTYYPQKDLYAWTKEEIPVIRQLVTTDFSGGFRKHCTKRKIAEHKLATLRTRALIEFNLHTSLRLSEALSADRANINWNKSELRVRDCKPPHEWKTVFIHGAESALQTYLDARNDDSPGLFVTFDGKRLTRNGAKSAMKALNRRIKGENTVGRITHKACRTTFITLLLGDGVDPKKVQKLAHHKSLFTTLNYYNRIIPSELKVLHKTVFQTI